MKGKVNAEPIRLPKTALVNAYYSWLCGLINVTQSTRSYWLLTKKLFNTPFYWSVPNDDNRAFEGMELRDRFCEEHNYACAPEYFEETCSMLELLIALAYRCECIMDGQCDNIPMVKWYWDILTNVGLSKFTDDAYNDFDGEVNIDAVLNTVINRTYHRNGRGGLFPLKHSKDDQRHVELWYQMSCYLVENYYSDEKIV